MLYCSSATSTEITQRLRAERTTEIPDDDPTLNPYWPRNGAATFVDPDGYRLIVAAAP